MCATKPVYSVVKGRVVFTSTGARVSRYMATPICERGPLSSKTCEDQALDCRLPKPWLKMGGCANAFACSGLEKL